MIKDPKKWILKEFTDTYSVQPTGTLHGYDYFEDGDGKWVYNIFFHHEGNFADVQVIFPRKVPVAAAINKARKKYKNTRWTNQPAWNN
jgi:hypothetical protein